MPSLRPCSLEVPRSDIRVQGLGLDGFPGFPSNRAEDSTFDSGLACYPCPFVVTVSSSGLSTVGFSRGRVAFDDSSAIDDLNGRDDVAETWLEVVVSLKLRRILEERMSIADKRTGRGFRVHCRVFAFA